MSRIALLLAVCGMLTISGCSLLHGKNGASPSSETEVFPVSGAEWTPLNPARGDASPQAATLWGDRGESVATGFLVKFVDGFSSPPHIHNVAYRGVVIRGTVHNDDPAAAEMFMPEVSYWTQPAGQVHITAAKGAENIAYIEIEDGPYLVLPTEKAFDDGERPINVDATNVVWVDLPGSASGARVAYLWSTSGHPGLSGFFVELPAGFDGTLVSHGSTLHAVVVAGQAGHRLSAEGDGVPLDPGSLVVSRGASVHHLSAPESDRCVLYLRTDGEFQVELRR